MQNILYKDILKLIEFPTEFTYLWGVKRVVLSLFEKSNCIIREDQVIVHQGKALPASKHGR